MRKLAIDEASCSNLELFIFIDWVVEASSGVATKDQLYKRPTSTKDQLVGSTKDQDYKRTTPTKD